MTGSLTAKARFLATYEREHATTGRVLRALPREHSTFKPHDRSNDAHTLAWTFVIEEQLILRALQKQNLLSSPLPKPPEKWETILHDFDQTHLAIIKELNNSANAQLDGTTQFFVAPKQMGDIPLEDFVWFMLYDQIHHRGQLSVYVRMTGGRVPSIYGPSADEPWT